jgi:hypothetical protein
VLRTSYLAPSHHSRPHTHKSYYDETKMSIAVAAPEIARVQKPAPHFQCTAVVDGAFEGRLRRI